MLEEEVKQNEIKKQEDENEYNKLEFMFHELSKQQQGFFERMRNCDTKLGILIALISGIILYVIPNIQNIFSIDWITENGLLFFIILLLLDIAIISLLFIGFICSLLGIKTKKAIGIGPKLFGEGNLNRNKNEILKKAIIMTEETINFNLKEERKKNKKFDISIILTIISLGLIIVKKIIWILI